MEGTRLNFFKDLPVQPAEHVVIELEDAIKAFPINMLYTTSLIVQKLREIPAYSTVERMRETRRMAQTNGMTWGVEYQKNEARATSAERERDEALRKLADYKEMYRNLKIRYHEVKQKNRSMRAKLGLKEPEPKEPINDWIDCGCDDEMDGRLVECPHCRKQSVGMTAYCPHCGKPNIYD